MGTTATGAERVARRGIEDDDVDVAVVVARARALGKDPIRALLLARGHAEHETLAPAPRGQNESVVAYFDRVRGSIMRDREFADDSVELLRQAREERTAQLERAIRGERAGDG